MSERGADATSQHGVTPPIERVIGRIVGAAPGPTLIATASVHGNEPAGFSALERVFADLQRDRVALIGEFIGLGGNLHALERGERFVHHDFNRYWTHAQLQAARRGTPPRVAEDRELAELLRELDAVIARARGPVVQLDLHTTSGESPPFATIGDTLRNRAFARRFPLPIVLGLEEHLEGTVLEYVNGLGHVTMGLEGGRHDDPQAAVYLEDAVWLALAAIGLLRAAGNVPRVEQGRERLQRACRNVPRVMEVRYRHEVRPMDEFRMRDGYRSFQRVRAGELLAEDRSGTVHAPQSGRILMPRYQPRGDDGFFIVRAFRPVWLTISALLRRLRLDAWLPLLPGIRRDPDHPETMLVDRRVARWHAVDLFHLLGYRRQRDGGHMLVVSRRRE